jgi:ApbE superfamily uncharacterized protein (UPF0280 family)
VFEARDYRNHMKTEELQSFNVTIEESDLQISAEYDLTVEAKILLAKYRHEIKNYIKKYPEFLTSLKPLRPRAGATGIIKEMCDAGTLTNVGPMATVAGAISKYIGKELLKYTDELIVENGGDVFIKPKKQRKVAIYAGKSVFSNRIGISIPYDAGEYGICTSSGTVGHSLSFGKADAAVVLSKDAVIADAAATATGNVVISTEDIEKGLETAMAIPGVEGAVIIVGDRIGAYGLVNIVKI